MSVMDSDSIIKNAYINGDFVITNGEQQNRPGVCLDDFCVYALLLGGSGGMLPWNFFLLHNAVGAFWGVFKHKK